MLQHKVAKLRVVDTSEPALARLKGRIQDPRVRFLLTDVRDSHRLEVALREAQVVIHAAAYKHVGFSLTNTPDYAMTNVIGTLNLMEIAVNSPTITHVLNISTDKVLNPRHALGSTKLVGEHLTMWAHRIGWNDGAKKFMNVRFGNVLASSGSVVEKAITLARAGKTIPLTDVRMRRFFMCTQDAVGLILHALDQSEGGETFVLKMPVIRIAALLAAINDRYRGGGVVVTKPEDGESIDEFLLSGQDVHWRETADMFVLCTRYPEREPRVYSTATQPALGRGDIEALLDRGLPEELR